MAENKQYIIQPQDHGNIMISEEVIATIAANAAGVTDTATLFPGFRQLYLLIK